MQSENGIIEINSRSNGQGEALAVTKHWHISGRLIQYFYSNNVKWTLLGM